MPACDEAARTVAAYCVTCGGSGRVTDAQKTVYEVVAVVGPDGATEAHGINIADAVHARRSALARSGDDGLRGLPEGIPRPRVAPAHAEAYMALLTAEKNMRAAKAGRRTARTAVVQNAELVENVISVLRMAFPDGVYDALEVTKVEKTTHATPRYRSPSMATTAPTATTTTAAR